MRAGMVCANAGRRGCTRKEPGGLYKLFGCDVSIRGLAPIVGIAGVDRGLPDAQDVAAPQFGDRVVVVPAALQLGSDVRGFADVVPPDAAVIEVRRQADMIDVNPLYRIVDRVDQIGDAGLGLGADNVVIATVIVGRCSTERAGPPNSR
jgi:hypothetical protein